MYATIYAVIKETSFCKEQGKSPCELKLLMVKEANLRSSVGRRGHRAGPRSASMVWAAITSRWDPFYSQKILPKVKNPWDRDTGRHWDKEYKLPADLFSSRRDC